MSEEIDTDDQQAYDEAENRAEINEEIAEGYGYPTEQEKLNQWKIFNDAIKAVDTTRTTYLTKGELGRPLFSVRFYLQCYNRAKAFNAPLIMDYFRKKARVITDSGMSNEGFILKMNVSSNKSIRRTHTKSEDTTKENTGE